MPTQTQNTSFDQYQMEREQEEQAPCLYGKFRMITQKDGTTMQLCEDCRLPKTMKTCQIKEEAYCIDYNTNKVILDSHHSRRCWVCKTYLLTDVTEYHRPIPEHLTCEHARDRLMVDHPDLRLDSR